VIAFLSQAAEQLRREGPKAVVQVEAPAAFVQALRAQGQEPPAPQTVTGLIDTGASITTITDAVAQSLGLQPTGSLNLVGVGGVPEQRPIYAASLTLPEYGVRSDPLEVASVPIEFGGGQFQILIGRDLLERAKLEYVGYEGVFDVDPAGAGSAAPLGKIPPVAYIGGGAAILGILGALAFGLFD
jgi:hypothetical protein